MNIAVSKRLMKWSAIAVLLLNSPLLWSAVSHDLQNPKVIASVNGENFPTASVDLMLSVLSRQDQTLTRSSLVSGIIENHLFARHAEQEYDQATLQVESRVGFPTEVLIQRQYRAMIRAAFSDELAHVVEQMGGSVDPLFIQPPAIAPDQLARLSQLNNQLVYRLTPAQEELAKSTIIARYRLPDGNEGQITYWELYSRENVQGRIELHQGKAETIQRLARQRLQQLFTEAWARQQSGLSESELKALNNMIRDKFLKLRYLQLKGIWSDIHDDNTALKRVASEVSEAEIRDYYSRNKESFRQVEQVTAYHIRTPNRKQAISAMQAMREGMDKETAVKTFSIAADRNNPQPGWLGSLQREQGVGNWLNSIAFMVEPGKWSQPIRSPQQQGEDTVWEIVYVVDRQEGYEPADSETVRYEASRMIARQKLNAAFRDTKARLFEEATIRLNPILLDTDLLPLETDQAPLEADQAPLEADRSKQMAHSGGHDV